MTEANINNGREIFEKQPGWPLQTFMSVMLAVLSKSLQQINNNHQYFCMHETSFHKRKVFKHAANVLVVS